MLSIIKTSNQSPLLVLTLTRSFSLTAMRAFEDSAKKSAVALQPSTIKSLKTGNSFNSFAEYRKSAVQHGPLRSKDFIYHTSGPLKAILSEEKDYGVSESFAKNAREQAYR